MRFSWVMGALVLAISIVAGPARVQARKPAEVILLGSSSMGGALGNELLRQAEAAEYHTYRRYRSSAGLCRPDFFDWWKEARKLPIGEGTRAALVYLGGNDAQGMRLRGDEVFRDERGREVSWLRFGEPGWDQRYEARVTSFVDTLCDEGLPRVLWIALVDARRDELQTRYEHVRELQRRGVAASACGVYVDTTGDAEFLGTREERKKRRLRSRDGVHLTRLGADVVWERIGPRVLSLIAEALMPPEPPVFGAIGTENSSPDGS